MKYDIEKIAKLLNLVDGMFHLQIMIKDDIPYIIDVTRRIPGDLYPYLIEYCDGVDYSKAVVKAYTTGLINDEFDKKIDKQKFIIRHCVMPKENGIYENIIIDDSIRNKILCKLDLVEKDYIIENYLHTQIAIIFMDTNYDNLIVKNINKLIRIKIK